MDFDRALTALGKGPPGRHQQLEVLVDEWQG